MTNFNIIKLHNEPYQYLIIATNYKSSLNNLEELKEKLQLDTGKVIFDFMMINGEKKNRFIECEVNNSICRRNTFKLVKEVNKGIRIESSRFFVNNTELVDRSVLPNALKHLIKLGKI